MASKTIARAKQYPVVTAFITLGALAGAAVAVAQFTGLIDEAVVSHAELAQIFTVHSARPHKLAQLQMDLIRQENRCSSVDIQIAILTDVIWRLEQSAPTGIRLVEKKEDLGKLKARRVKLNCAALF